MCTLQGGNARSLARSPRSAAPSPCARKAPWGPCKYLRRQHPHTPPFKLCQLCSVAPDRCAAQSIKAQCAVNHMSSQPPTTITHMFSMGLDQPGPIFASPLHRQSPLRKVAQCGSNAAFPYNRSCNFWREYATPGYPGGCSTPDSYGERALANLSSEDSTRTCEIEVKISACSQK